MTDSKWYVLYTRSRHEKAVEGRLNSAGIQAYVPKVTIRKRWSDRHKHVEEPVFKSYCFARFPIINKSSVLTHPGIVSIVRFNSTYAQVDESVIRSIQIAQINELQMDPYPYFTIGERIRIKKGKLAGFEGFIAEKRDDNISLVVTIDSISASMRCLVDADQVELC